MLTPKNIDKVVAEACGISVDAIHSDETKREVSVPRAIAMLMLKKFLRWGTIRSRKYYSKSSHTTVMSALRNLNRLMDREPHYKELVAIIEYKLQQKVDYVKQKQRYNLNHRIRQKGYTLDHKHKTLSLRSDELQKLDKKQLKKLVTKHNYNIQYKLF